MPRSRGSRNRSRRGGRRPKNGRSQRGRDFSASMGGAPVKEISSLPRQVQPVPNGLNVTLVHTVLGWIATPTTTAQYGMALNDLVAPTTKKGGATAVLPNNSGGDPAGLLNYLLNTATGTGLYVQCVVKRSRVVFTLTPTSASDASNVVLSVVAGPVAYSGVSTAADGPNSITKICSFISDRKGNTLAMSVVPRLVDGHSPSAWRIAGKFSYAIVPPSPVYLQVNFQTADQVASIANIPYSVRLEHDVEFFQRNDTSLED
jgi:hypothetical protein